MPEQPNSGKDLLGELEGSSGKELRKSAKDIDKLTPEDVAALERGHDAWMQQLKRNAMKFAARVGYCVFAISAIGVTIFFLTVLYRYGQDILASGQAKEVVGNIISFALGVSAPLAFQAMRSKKKS